jgi:hypothetical protein
MSMNKNICAFLFLVFVPVYVFINRFKVGVGKKESMKTKVKTKGPKRKVSHLDERTVKV